MFRQNVRQFALTFDGAPPELPPLPGILQHVRHDHDVLITLVNPSEETLATLNSLQPATMSDSQLGLEDAFINYLGEPGTAGFLS